jgi:TonB family protein
MALRLTSRNVQEARVPRDKTLMQGEEREGRPDEHSPRDASAGGRNAGSDKAGSDKAGSDKAGSDKAGSQKKVVAADVALDWVLQEIVQQARLATTATGAFIGIVRAHSIICQATSGSNAAEFVTYLNRERRMLDSCLNGNAPQRCRDSETFEQLDANTCRYLGARSVVIVPIVDDEGEKLGVFGVFSPQVDAFSTANIVAMQTLSRRIGDAMAQIDRCTSASNGSASARRQPDTGKSLIHDRIHDRLLRAARRPLPPIRGPVAWVLGILAVLLPGCWILSRNGNLSQWTIHTSAKAPTVVTSPVPSVSSAPPLSDHISSGSADANSGQSPAVRAVAKESAAMAAGGKLVKDAPVASKAGKKISARSTPRVPDLEIENTLDDASSESLPSASVDTSRAPNQSSISVPPPASIGKEATLANAGASSVAGGASVGSLAREAAHLTRAPDPTHAEAAPPASATSQKASAASTDPALEAPIMISENTALERIAEQVKPDYPPGYPEDARAKDPQATVAVDVIVGKDGQVESVAPLKGDPRLLAAAAKVVAKWRFTPLPRNHRFVRFESHITVQFASP